MSVSVLNYEPLCVNLCIQYRYITFSITYQDLPLLYNAETMRTWACFQLLVAAVFAVYVLSPVVTSVDSIWTIYTATSIIRERNLNLDEYLPLLQQSNFYATRDVGGHRYEFFPYGTALMAVPFVWLFDWLALRTLQIDIGARFQELRPSGLEQLIASIIVALAVGVFFMTIKIATGDRRAAAVAAIVLAFGTSAWSTASRALWQHGPSMLLLTVALCLSIVSRQYPRAIWILGIVLGTAYVVRPTNAIAVVAFTVWVAWAHRRSILPYFFGLGVVLFVFVVINERTWGLSLPEYYMANRIGDNPNFLEALAGNLVSPARGLLIFSPVLIFSAIGVWLQIVRRAFVPLELALGAIVGAHWLAISSFAHWWGGHAYGPRLFTDMMPFLVFLLVPCIRAIVNNPTLRWRLAGLVFAGLLVISVSIHMRGATVKGTWMWNSEPVGVDEAPARLWDFRDLQFLRS